MLSYAVHIQKMCVYLKSNKNKFCFRIQLALFFETDQHNQYECVQIIKNTKLTTNFKFY